ncbi:MAG: thiamine-phosphate kinase, partial [Alphaproteobacteria bacterium]|nr:thiamine-phosphate kinase [Alphaproteobacteria bacterium]
PQGTDENWFRRFADGLREEQEHYPIVLAGGDTTATQGTLTASLTAIGTVPQGAALLRKAARPGDRVYVSGTLGDAALGLAVLKEKLHVPPPDSLWLKERYFLPQPRLMLGMRLRGLAHASMDVSDGLVQDLGQICAASGVGAVIHRHRLPLSEAALHVLQDDETRWRDITGGGDDYELLFTVPHSSEEEVQALAHSLLLPLTCIGDITAGTGVQLLDEHGQDVTPQRGGYTHF